MIGPITCSIDYVPACQLRPVTQHHALTPSNPNHGTPVKLDHDRQLIVCPGTCIVGDTYSKTEPTTTRRIAAYPAQSTKRNYWDRSHFTSVHPIQHKRSLSPHPPPSTRSPSQCLPIPSRYPILPISRVSALSTSATVGMTYGEFQIGRNGQLGGRTRGFRYISRGGSVHFKEEFRDI